MIKRIVILVISCVVILAMSTGLYIADTTIGKATVGEYSETFVGYVSETAYDTEEETLQAFLVRELTGATAEPEYVGFRPVGELSSDELKRLVEDGLTDADVISGKKVCLDYLDKEASKSTNVYLLETVNGWLYYIAPHATGEAITNSYLQTVLDPAKYANCTASSTVGIRTVGTAVPTDTSYRQVIYFADDKAFFNQDLPGFTTDAYFEEKDGGIECYLEHPLKNDGLIWSQSAIDRDLASSNRYLVVYITNGTEQIAVSEFDTMLEIVDLAFMMDLDASYFVKTDKGFSMLDDKYMQVCQNMAGSVFADQIADAWEDYNIHFRADYYVTEGRLSASETVLTMSNGEQLFSMRYEIQYTDFGTTEVEIRVDVP